MTEDASRPTQPPVHHSSFHHPLKVVRGRYQSHMKHLKMFHPPLDLSASVIDVSDAEESLASSISPFLSTHHVSIGSNSTNIYSCEDVWTWGLYHFTLAPVQGVRWWRLNKSFSSVIKNMTCYGYGTPHAGRRRKWVKMISCHQQAYCIISSPMRPFVAGLYMLTEILECL